MSLYGYWMEFAQKKHFCAAHFYNKCAILEKLLIFAPVFVL